MPMLMRFGVRANPHSEGVKNGLLGDFELKFIRDSEPFPVFLNDLLQISSKFGLSWRTAMSLARSRLQISALKANPNPTELR